MVTLSDNARKALDEYLRQTRMYLQGAVSVDAKEVEQNITEHIENELRGAAEPVGLDALDAVLKKLGSPRQWVPEEELPEWRRLILRLRTGPDDWRLAYLSFGLLILAFLLFLVFPLFRIFFVLLSASFCAARAALSATEDRRLPRPQKWLIYPSLIVTYLILGYWLLLVPILASISLADYVGIEWARENMQVKSESMQVKLIEVGIASAAIALWCLLLGIASRRWPGWTRVVFSPFAGSFNPIWARVLMWIGLVLLLIPFSVLLAFLS